MDNKTVFNNIYQNSTMTNKKIALFLTNLDVGGAELLSVELGNFLADYYDVTLICAYATDEQARAQNPNSLAKRVNKNIKVIYLTNKDKWHHDRDYYTDQLRKVIKRDKINFLLTTGEFTDSITVNISPRNFSWMTVTHGPYDRYEPRTEEYDTCQRVYDAVDKVIYLTDLQVSKYNCEKSKFHKIYNFSPRQKVVNDKFDKFTFCVVSRAMPYKGWSEVFSASERLIDLGYKISTLFIGDGPEYQRMAASNCHKDIKFYGNQEDPEHIISQSHVGILVSQVEAQPLSIIDYINNGLPVIVTPVGACPDMITSDDGKKCGLIVDYGDVYQLEIAMKQLLDDQNLYATLASNTKKNIQKFDKETYMSQMLTLIREM